METGRVGAVNIAKLQTFRFKRAYDAIFLSWCVGYLDRRELIKFLQKAKQHLSRAPAEGKRAERARAYIVVLDNARNPDLGAYTEEGQTVRSQMELEAIFGQTGMKIEAKTEQIELHPEYDAIVVWALY